MAKDAIDSLTPMEAFEAHIASGYVSTKEAQTMLGISFNTLQRLVERGNLHRYTVGTVVRYKVSEIQHAFDKQTA